MVRPVVVGLVAGPLIWAAILAIAASAMTLDKNLAAIEAAIDPSQGPPIVDPVFPGRHSFAALGGPGPYTPEVPTRLGISGVAVIRCALALSGRLSDCALIADAPLNLHFGDAALKMASTGYMTAEPPPNFNAADVVRVVVTFRIPRGGYRP